MARSMKCPYRDAYKKTCTHKGCKPNKAKKRFCVFKHPHNCKLFLEWVKIAELKENASNSL